jgi:lactate dehydrogenase-like 2-hydroxyacid dehydrogenase
MQLLFVFFNDILDAEVIENLAKKVLRSFYSAGFNNVDIECHKTWY